MSQIKNIHAREIIDSRGTPTIEVDVEIANNLISRASVPSGASTGTYEAHELRDGNKKRFFNKGVLKAVENVNTEIKETLIGFDVTNQKVIDQLMIDLDGSKNKSRLGANSILAVSLACSKAAASFLNLPLYTYIGGLSNSLPTPLMNIVNGGCHANNNLDFQEFMIVPMGFKKFSDSLRAGSEIFHTLRNLLSDNNFAISVGDEGGFAPDFKSNKECLDYIVDAIVKAGYAPGKEVALALDVASSEFFDKNKYFLASESLKIGSDELIKYYEKLIKDYPIISIEDGLDENDWNGWKNMTGHIGEKCQLVGDDLFVTSVDRLRKGITKKCANSILIKLNQIGTLSETIETISEAKMNKYNTIISHRSGETEDTFIADFSVGMSSGQIKTGSLSRSERIAKYNQLLRIEEENSSIIFSGTEPFQSYL